MRKCPKGMVCFQNLATISILILVSLGGFFAYSYVKNNSNAHKPTTINIINPSSVDSMDNPYAPPLRNDGYLVGSSVAINQATNVGAVDVAYRQMGILTPTNQGGKDAILPLMGRPLFTSRSKFQYYTVSNQHNNVKLPISVNGRSGMDEYGVDEVFSGDTIYVEGYDDVFKVTKYDNGTMKYLPFA